MPAVIQPERILHDLAELWVSLGKPNDEDSAGVLRACAMTLVVVAEAREDLGEVGETLASLMREHPSRAIVVRVPQEQQAELGARVFAQCWMPFGQRRQICCEQIEITAPEGALADLGSVLLPLVVPDLPVILWSRIPRLFATPALDALAGLATKLIIDSSAFAAPREALAHMTLEVAAGRIIGDLSWTRLTRWRELIAQVFENPEYFAQLPSVTEVRISHAGPSATALYMGAWLQMCLEKAGSRPQLRFQPAPGNGPAGLRGVEFSSADPAALDVALLRGDASVEVRVNTLVNRIVHAGRSDCDLLREELSIPGKDPTFESTLALAARLAIE